MSGKNSNDHFNVSVKQEENTHTFSNLSFLVCGKDTPYSMNSLLASFSGNLEGYVWRCLRLFRAIFEGCVGGVWDDF